MDKLHLRLFGGLFVEIAGKPVVGFKTQKETLLIAYLALAQRPLTRETLADLLWDEREQSLAMSNLRTLLSRLRKVVGDYLQIDRQSVALLLDKVWVDVLAFEAQTASAQKNNSEKDVIEGLETAVALVAGDFLAGTAIDTPELELWQINTSEKLHGQHSAAREQLATYYFYKRDYRQGIIHARALVHLNPINEQAHRLLMRLLARNGEINAALQQYQICAGELTQQLGVEPAIETQALYGRLQTAQASPPIQLPLFETSFVGRAAELRQIDQILEEENGRLLTIVGIGGVGKTRLALQAANERKQSYLHGIYFISLDMVQTASAIPAQIAQAMALSLDNKHIGQQLMQYLKDKELLLLFDNIEHLLQTPETVSFIQQLRQNAPYLTLIVTSRQPLRLRSEWLIRLGGLPYPAKKPQANGHQTFAAVNLFAQRAAQQGFSIQPQMEADVNQVCRLVEGLPLAIELITATMDLYTLAEIIRLIQFQMDKLAVSFHDLPARHRSIHAVFDYSWQLLSAEEQQVLGRLSLFQGQFTQTAVTQITTADQRILQKLVHKSLLRQEADGRFSFHTLIRQFITEKWEVETAVVQQHSTYYLTLLAQQEPHIYRQSMPQALQTIRDDFENMRLAWQNALQDQQYPLLQNCLPVIVTLPRFLNYLPDWVQLLALAREKTQDAPTEMQLNLAVAHATTFVQLGQTEQAHEILQLLSSELLTEGNAFAHASAIYQEAEIAYIQGDYPKATAFNQKALTISQKEQFTNLEAFCYKQLGAAYVKLGKTEEATAVLNKALTLFQQSEQPYCEAEVYHILGIQAYHLGQYEESLNELQKSITRKKALAGSLSIAMTLNSIGLVANDMGDYDAAEHYYGEALQIQQNTANNQEKSVISHNLGLLAQHRRQFEKAEQYYQHSLSIDPSVRQTAVTTGNLGDIAFFSGNYALAKKRYAQGLAKRETMQDTRGIIWSCCCNAVTANILGEYEKGQQFAERAIQIAEELNEQPRLAFALTYWGDARRGLGYREEAKEAYQRVLAIRQTLNIVHLTAVPVTRLGQLALEDEEIETANVYVEQLLPYLQKSPLGNLFMSGEAPLLCYQVLAIQGDSRADAILQAAYTTLRTTAEQFTSEATKKMFLHNVAAHRRLIMLVEM